MPTHVNEITHDLIGASIEVHRALDPGLLESAYQEYPLSARSQRILCLRGERRLKGHFSGANGA